MPSRTPRPSRLSIPAVGVSWNRTLSLSGHPDPHCPLAKGTPPPPSPFSGCNAWADIHPGTDTRFLQDTWTVCWASPLSPLGSTGWGGTRTSEGPQGGKVVQARVVPSRGATRRASDGLGSRKGTVSMGRTLGAFEGLGSKDGASPWEHPQAGCSHSMHPAPRTVRKLQEEPAPAACTHPRRLHWPPAGRRACSGAARRP